MVSQQNPRYHFAPHRLLGVVAKEFHGVRTQLLPFSSLVTFKRTQNENANDNEIDNEVDRKR
jgi:hypothetical protein